MPDDLADGWTVIGRQLMMLRVQAEFTQAELADHVGVTQSQVSKIEHGGRMISPEAAELWCTRCGATPADRDRIVAAATTATQARGGHVVFHSAAALSGSHLQSKWAAAERGATDIWAANPTMILGQLQTPTYAAAVFAGPPVRHSPEDVADLVDQRAQRWALLRDPARHWTFIQTVGALQWPLLDPAGMASQLAHMAEISRLPNVRVGIIPAMTRADFTLPSGCHLYGRAAVAVTTLTAVGLLTAAADVEAYVALFTRLEELAVFGDEARAVLARVEAEYRAAG